MAEGKSYSRRAGVALITSYIIAVIHRVIWLSEPMPDMPPVLSMTILGLYGFNVAKAVSGKVGNNGQT